MVILLAVYNLDFKPRNKLWIVCINLSRTQTHNLLCMSRAHIHTYPICSMIRGHFCQIVSELEFNVPQQLGHTEKGLGLKAHLKVQRSGGLILQPIHWYPVCYPLHSELWIRGSIWWKFLLFPIEMVCYDPSSEPSRRDGSDEGSQYMFLCRNNKNYP